MGGYGTDVAEVQGTFQELTDVKADLDTCIKNLDAANQEVLGSWAGGAADAYRALSERVREKGESLNTALENLAGILESAGASYERMESEGEAGFSGGGFAEL